MTYRGHMQNGVAVLDVAVNLPDGTPVRIAVESPGSDFWQNKSVEELALEQGVQPISRLDELAGDWPAEDSVDEFLALLRKARS
jgi:hypothetical protein